MKHVQHPSRKSSQEQKGTGAETGRRQGYSVGPEFIQEGLPKTWWKGSCKVGAIQVSGCVQYRSDVGLGHRARAGVTPQCSLGG